jgi:two-component system NtrC family sensor kinase
MALSLSQRGDLSACWFKSNVPGLCLVMGLSLLSTSFLYAQSRVRIDSLPSDGLTINSGWRWHSGDNSAWASPNFDDTGWDTIRPNRNIVRQPHLKQMPQGWLRLTFLLDSTVAQTKLAFLINQTGASEIYLDGRLFQRLGKVGSDYQQQSAYSPTLGDAYLLPDLSVGQHVLAVRLSQHRPPWYVPKFLYFNQSVFRLTLFPAGNLTNQILSRVYIQTFGNYLLVGIFLMLGVIHFMYYHYRRKRINLAFGLTMLFGSGCIVFIELVGLMSNPSINEWLFLSQGLLVTLFMVFLLVTYYIYLEQPISWQLRVVAILLLIPRLITGFVETTQLISITSMIAIVALFADGIRICIDAIRARRINARFMLTSILSLVLILIVGGLISWWFSGRYPASGNYTSSITNLLFFLILPVSFAIILAREYAQTNRNLEDRLTEVAQLSQEKESILTQQNQILERQVTERTAELSQSLTELRETQQQLIHREKMASLGELTAGIAHEIQNPLNFVNNFADVSGELVQELKQELEKEDRDRERDLEDEILGDLAQNLQKISHHGGRAASIVRAMLDHSRTSTGQREPTDLNALTENYLSLSYHGLPVTDDSLKVQIITYLDPAVGNVMVVAQDIGRVLINLFNNAFYAVQEHWRTAPADFVPTVTVSTKRVGEFAEIRVSDNGAGIPDAIREKIFQPFFTTKPTGEGTGLGLSLSYDIITKGYGGLLTLGNNAGGGATFLIRLPSDSTPSSIKP